jgi:AAA ATPase domain
VTELLEHIDLLELSSLAGLPPALVPPPGSTPEKTIRQFARWVKGNEVEAWLERVRSCSAREAIELVIAVLQFPQADGATREAVTREAWKVVLEENRRCRERVFQALQVMMDLSDCGDNPFGADAEHAEQAVRQLQLLETAPVDEAGWESARVTLAHLEDIAGDAEAMAEMRLSDAEQRFERARGDTLVAITRILSVLRPSATREDRERSRQELREILVPFVGAYARTPPLAVQLPMSGPIARDSLGRDRIDRPDASVPSPERRLSTFARLTYDSAPAAAAGISNAEELRKQEDRISAMHPAQRRAAEWLAIAKATENEHLKAIAMGEGFLEQGEASLKAGRKGARDFLRDSVRMFGKTARGDDARLERALLALCVERSHSEYSAGERASSLDPAIWIETPDEMFRWLERGTNLRTLALEWLEIDDDIADHLFAFLERRVKHQEQLRGQFASLCLMARELRHRARRCLIRCSVLVNSLEAPALSELWNHLLDAVPESLSSSASSDENRRLFEIRVRAVLAHVESLAEGLGGIAPLPQLRDGLPRLLEEMGTAAGEPRRHELSVDILVDSLYPGERLRECAIPLLLRNPPDGAPVQDARLRLSLGPNSRTEKIRFQDHDEIIGTLLPGDDAQRWCYVDFDARLTQDKAEVALSLEWSVGERAGRTQKTVGIRPGTRASEKSPYNTGGSVTGGAFVGRDKQLAQIHRALAGSDEPQQVLIYGIRRIGKTSLLKKVIADPRIVMRFYVVEWDSQDLPDSATTDEVAIHLCNQVIKALPRASRGYLDFSRERMREDPYAELERFFDAVRNGAPTKQLLIAIDEFDRLMELADISERNAAREARLLGPSEMFQKRFFGALRKEVMKEHGVTLVVAGLPRLLHGQSYDERLFGLFKPVAVGRLTEPEAEQIISSSRVLEKMHPLARDRIHEATGLQPYLLQVLCDQLFSRMVESGRDLVTRGDVDAVIDETMLPNESYFSDYVSLIRGDEEVLWALAKATPGRRFAAPSEVAVALRSRGINAESAQVVEVLERYRSDGSDSDERPIIESPLGGKRDRYRFVIGLLKDHLIRRFE